ncbi:Abhydrolase-4 domain-containing protein [Mycena sanguinolenta]|uniref:Abhydrolase-4 domain-containing protein n=1 Tax=Mycena sanguinolenta TaxID=230812 RepID=A0A8H6XUP0_9AGAR|nr:Abhydrolase-4 domain-containing protein [Mycena sanguinolenta]
MAPIGNRPLACCFAFLVFWFLLSGSEKWRTYVKYRSQRLGETQPRMGAIDVHRAKDDFSWESISPTEELIWNDCYSDRQCARLKVPLDYTQPDGASAAIAMIRVHSVVPHNSPSYRGPVLINPGGPGGSGVDMIAWAGPMLSTIIGPEFDIIGFDPRGVGRSTPRISFFASRAEREVWSVQDVTLGSVNSSADALARTWARGIVVGQLAGARDDGSLRFMNTDHTARDMLKIVQAHGRDKLQYWGFSYGSALGATFAAMFPQNVGRLVIDGVLDSENYFAGKWSNNLIDTDKVWMAFINGCIAAGPKACALFAPTVAEIIEKVDKIYAAVRARPIPVRTDTSFGLVDWTTVRGAIFLSFYSPYSQFSTMARALADLYEGNGTTLFKIYERPAFKCACDPAQYQFEHLSEAVYGLLCNDAKRIPAKYEDVLEHYQRLRETSSWADVWEPIRMPCLAWPDFPKDYFRGPFVANTSFPLLLVGNTLDPVTPLWAAKKMSQGFAGSVVLTQDSPGILHSSCLSTVPSLVFPSARLNTSVNISSTVRFPSQVLYVLSTYRSFPPPESVGDADRQTNFAVSAADRNLFEAAKKLAEMAFIRFPMGI